MNRTTDMTGYTAFVCTPQRSMDPALAIAACRAGAVGVFDLAGYGDVEQTRRGLNTLRRFTSGVFGIRHPQPVHANEVIRIIEMAGERLGWLIVSPDAARRYAGELLPFREAHGRVLVEVGRWSEELATLGAVSDGWIVRGREAMDRDGATSAGPGTLTLVTQALMAGAAPVYAWGGIGTITAPAVIAAGCGGFVLADQMLALREARSKTPAASADGDWARDWAERFVNTAGVLRALSTAIKRAAGVAQSALSASDSELAIIQQNPAGCAAPPEFAAAISAAGATPILAVPRSLDHLAASALPWAALLTGKQPASELIEQVHVCGNAGATAALLADARADQALSLARSAIPVFYPVASAPVLRSLIAQGARHFVIRVDDEGGGEALAMWESLGFTLMLAATGNRDLQVWLAGSASHATCATATACFAAQLQSHAIRCAVVLDEAYRNTREYQGSGAQDQCYTVAALHQVLVDKCRESAADRLRRASGSAADHKRRRKACDVAIVGIGGIFPGANSPREFWHNILNKVDAIQEIPASRWDWRMYFDENRDAADRIYSRWGGFMDDMPFDPTQYGIPPKALRSVDPLQLMALEVISRTLDDAGYALRDFDRERASIIVGASGGIGDVGAQYALRAESARFAGKLDPEVAARLPRWTEDSFAGLLLNVAAGRAANRLDFGGVNYAVDAACASSLTAVYQAVGELEAGRSDMVIAGGIDTVQGPFGYLCFSKTQALSPSGRCSTFDVSADGIVISEGIAMVALKRLADAERDGDKIYAVIKGVGGSSDGRARSMTAPHPAGQIRALQRSYGQAGYSPSTVGLLEAHGTGTVAGDAAELQTVTRLLRDSGAAANQTAIGSVKTLIGHTKATAGIAGLIKTCLALHHKVLPPHANVTHPSASIADVESPLYLVSDAMPWPCSSDHPRRAGVSAFGFGGTNFHVTMEEYVGDFSQQPRQATMDRWPAEVLVWRATDRTALAEKMHSVQRQCERGAAPCLRDLAWSLAHAPPDKGETAALVLRPQDSLPERLGPLIEHVRNPDAKPLPRQGYFATQPQGVDGKIAAVFAGQGSQYRNMMRQLALLFPAFRRVLDTADELLREPLAGRLGRPATLSRLIYPGGLYNERQKQAAADVLTRTDIAQPAIGVVEAGLWAVMKQMGLAPDMAAGHSYGEYAALYAAGAIDLPTLLDLSCARGRFIAEACEGKDAGTMAAARGRRDKVEQIAARFSDLLVANHNAPQQSILSGSRQSIAAAVAALKQGGIDAVELPVGAAFHSQLVAPAQALLAEKLAVARFSPPVFPVYSNTTGAQHSDNVEVLKRTLSEHLARPVEFVAEIEAMYEAGARVFVGLGPKNVQSSMVNQILGDRPHCVARIDDHVGGLKGLLCAVGALLAHHVPLRIDPLFEGRDCQLVDLDNLSHNPRKAALPSHAWLLNGAGARRVTDPPPAPLTLEEAEALTNPDAAHARPAQVVDSAGAEPATQGADTLPNREPDPKQATPVPDPLQRSSCSAALLAYQATMKAFVSSNERVAAAALGAVEPAVARTGPPSPADVLNQNHGRPARRLANRYAGQPTRVQDSADSVRQRGPVRPDTGAASQARGNLGSVSSPLPRYVVSAQSECVEGFAKMPLRPGGWLITQDSAGIAMQLKGLLDRLPGVVPVVIAPEELAADNRLAPRVQAARRVTGGLSGLVHLSAVAMPLLPATATLAQWREQTEQNDKSLFRVLRYCAGDLSRKGATVLAASGLGGLLGRDLSLQGLTASGGATGLLKCVNEEWHTGCIKAVDLNAQRPADENARLLLNELQLPGGRIEVGYHDGIRKIFRTVPGPLATAPPANQRTPSADWVVLASGGARGITAELIRDLAAAGVTLVITGRTPEPAAEDTTTAALTDDAALKAHFIQEARSVGTDVRPVDIERRLVQLHKRREMAANLAALRAAGGRVDYRVCDMSNPQATAALFADIYDQYGRLDGLVHGAGVIEDKLLLDKSSESWFNVFDTKADSAFLLSRHLRAESLRFVALFTSVAGRYGNSGQSDYAAANEVVNRLAWALQARYGKGAKVSAINWGPWAATRHGQGMVSADAARKFAARGVALVQPDAGRALFMHEITAAPLHEVEVIAGEGPWDQLESDNGRFIEATAFVPALPAAHRPLLRQAGFCIGAGNQRIVTRTVSRSTDLYLDQHLVNETAVMPAAVAVEMMAEAALATCPDYFITEMSRIRILNGIRFTDKALPVQIVVDIGAASAGDGRITVELALYQDSAKGRPSYRASAHLNGVPLKCPVYRPLIKADASPVSAHDAYRRVLFHGPCLQNIAALTALDRQGAVATLIRTPSMDHWLSEPPAGGAWLFDPGCLDAAAQMGVVYGNVINGESALPNSVARIRRFGDEPMPASEMYFLAHPEQPQHRIRADVAFVDEHGKLRLFIEQLECTSSEALNSIGGGWKGRICV